ncbi:MAG: nitrous oxide reductase accessory protein NosL [Flavobacteriaceae bacterium]|jgi:copper chaperone NosL|nr:nitrous oxide reductase accessory protein NosL [Flavobacteriaceae bacterium]
MKKTGITLLSRVLLFLVGVLFIAVIFLPLWQIQLDAPQYPEGLTLKIFANKLGGDVEIINGLNHYIGMQTLHAENFFEFSILSYILGAFALLSFLLAIFCKSRKLLLTFFIVFVAFVILTAIDFYRWEYEYGHNLDPDAAIKVPEMAYQPPLLGYKQLLNFGAFSIPDIGGWLLLGVIVLLLIAIIKEFKFNKNIKNIAPILLLSVVFMSCNNKTPQPIKLNVESCDFCKMTISDGKFGAELMTNKGKVYKFDDIHCMVEYSKTNKIMGAAFFVSIYDKDNALVPAETAYYIQGGDIKSPMMGNCIAFSSETAAKEYLEKFNAKNVSWNNLIENE